MTLIVQKQASRSVYRILFSYFSTKTYVVGIQKNSLNETVLLAPKTYV